MQNKLDYGKKIVMLISKRRYVLLVLFLLFKFGFDATNGIWYGDFWEHSAVVFELMQNKLSLSHPILDISAPHSFISPYHWIVSKFAQLFRISSFEALGFWGIINFCLFTYAINYYSKAFTNQNNIFTSFYALLFILFLWGHQKWGFSGFFHFELIADVLPYPSTFATALSFIGLGLGFKILQDENLIQRLLLSLICVLVLLSHPLTFIFLASGLICQSISSHKALTSTVKTIFLLIISSAIALLWPYYSIFAILTGAGNVYHLANISMYKEVLPKIWPILLLSPLLLPAFKSKRARPIFLHLLVLVAVYIFGWYTGKYSYGRDITFIVILIQFLVANQFAHFEVHLSQSYPRGILTYQVLLGITLFCLSFTWLYPTMTRSLTVLNSLVLDRTVSNQHSYKNLTFLPQHLKKGSVVLSDPDTSWLVPSFGGKVIGALHVQAFVFDDDQRRVDLIDFFADDTSSSKRQSIIQKYKPDYLLIDKFVYKDWKEILNSLDSFSKRSKIYENDQYLLIRFD